MEAEAKPVLLFDGECGLCHGIVRAILRLERRHDLLFASQQSEAGRRLLAGHMLPSGPGTVVFVRGRRSWFRSDAVLQTLLAMGGPWPLAARLGRLIPRALRDRAYDLVSRHRRQIFGTRSDACSLPRPDQRERFLV